MERFFEKLHSSNGEQYVRNQVVSHMVDILLPPASASSVTQLIDTLSRDLWTVCTDVFASYILQATLVQCIKRLQVNELLALSVFLVRKAPNFLYPKIIVPLGCI